MSQIAHKLSKNVLSSLSHAKSVKIPFRIEDLKITMDFVKPSEFKPVASYMAKVFCRDEPKAKAIGAFPEDFQQLAFDGLRKSMDPCLSIAFKRDNSEIVSALIIDHFPFQDKYFDPNNNPYHPKYEAPLTLANKMKTFFRDYYWNNGLTGKVARVSLGSTEDEFRGRNLAMYELNALAAIGLSLGFNHCFGECSNVFSRKNAFDAGMRSLHTIDYDTFVVNGKKPYQDLNRLMTDHVNTRVGKKKFKDLAKECTLVYAPMEEILKVTSERLNL